jgi:tripartite-type tricarboxylate transporter receptor subunit TctC
MPKHLTPWLYARRGAAALLAIVVAGGAVAFAERCHADTFPSKPVTVIVPAAPGAANMLQPALMDPWPFADFIKVEEQKWGKIVRDLGLKVE